MSWVADNKMEHLADIRTDLFLNDCVPDSVQKYGSHQKSDGICAALALGSSECWRVSYFIMVQLMAHNIRPWTMQRDA